MIAWVFQTVAHGPVTGRALHGRFFAALAERDPAAAARMHAPGELRPFTWAVLPAPPPARTQLRLSLLGKAEALFDDRPPWTAGTAVDLDGRPLLIERVYGPGEHPWAGATTFDALRRSAQTATGPLRVEFVTPTAFRAGDADRLEPDPRLMVESWRRSWAAFGGDADGPPLPGAGEIVRPAPLKASTRIVADDPAVPTAGFVGTVEPDPAVGASPEVVGALHALAAFAFYCGTGRKRAMGMGLTRATARK